MNGRRPDPQRTAVETAPEVADVGPGRWVARRLSTRCERLQTAEPGRPESPTRAVFQAGLRALQHLPANTLAQTQLLVQFSSL